MKYILILLLSFSGISLSAQVIDNPGGGIAIPKSNTSVTPSSTPVSADSPFSFAPPKKTNSTIEIGGKENNFSLIKKDEFVNRGAEFQDRVNASVNPKGESNEAFRGNQFFGEIKCKAEFIQVLARDFGYADGDMIKVSVNDRVIVAEVMLTNDFKGIQILLQPGFNKIDFEALNQGTSGPNTAEFMVYDDKEKLVSNNQWNLATGFKATVIVIKE
jgi:hypothetical protein